MRAASATHLGCAANRLNSQRVPLDLREDAAGNCLMALCEVGINVEEEERVELLELDNLLAHCLGWVDAGDRGEGILLQGIKRCHAGRCVGE
jgi:hypothetical protein